MVLVGADDPSARRRTRSLRVTSVVRMGGDLPTAPVNDDASLVPVQSPFTYPADSSTNSSIPDGAKWPRGPEGYRRMAEGGDAMIDGPGERGRPVATNEWVVTR